MKYQATKKFKELDTSSSYRGLTRDQFRALWAGRKIEINSPPDKLVEEKYIKRVGEKNGN